MGRLKNNARYLYVGSGDAKQGLEETAWAARFLTPGDGTPEQVSARSLAHVLGSKALLAALPDLLTRQLVYYHSSELPWARALDLLTAMQSHVLLIYAWHYHTPINYRPPGPPVVGRNAPVAVQMARAGLTADRVAAFVTQTYAGYVAWANQSQDRPQVMSLEHVRASILAWDAKNRKENALEQPLDRSELLPPKPRGLDHLRARK